MSIYRRFSKLALFLYLLKWSFSCSQWIWGVVALPYSRSEQENKIYGDGWLICIKSRRAIQYQKPEKKSRACPNRKGRKSAREMNAHFLTLSLSIPLHLSLPGVMRLSTKGTGEGGNGWERGWLGTGEQGGAKRRGGERDKEGAGEESYRFWLLCDKRCIITDSGKLVFSTGSRRKATPGHYIAYFFFALFGVGVSLHNGGSHRSQGVCGWYLMEGMHLLFIFSFFSNLQVSTNGRSYSLLLWKMLRVVVCVVPACNCCFAYLCLHFWVSCRQMRRSWKTSFLITGKCWNVRLSWTRSLANQKDMDLLRLRMLHLLNLSNKQQTLISWEKMYVSTYFFVVLVSLIATRCFLNHFNVFLWVFCIVYERGV